MTKPEVPLRDKATRQRSVSLLGWSGALVVGALLWVLLFWLLRSL